VCGLRLALPASLGLERLELTPGREACAVPAFPLALALDHQLDAAVVVRRALTAGDAVDHEDLLFVEIPDDLVQVGLSDVTVGENMRPNVGVDARRALREQPNNIAWRFAQAVAVKALV
jgi:hypothetical protein